MIDPKELHIGAHVDYDGKRMIVVCISGAVHGADISLIEPTEKAIYKDVWACNIQPIPITAELLMELGFENTSSTRRITYTKGYEYDGLWVEARNLKDRWEVFVSDNDWDGRIVVRYLHELEAFLYLTTKTELIKE